MSPWNQIVFVGPFEHHSNLLPWRELGAEVKGYYTTLKASLCQNTEYILSYK